MLIELARYNDFGSRHEINFFIRNVIKPYPISVRDLEMTCLYSTGNLTLRVDALIALLRFVGFASIDISNEHVCMTHQGHKLLEAGDDDSLYNGLIVRTVEEAFNSGIFPIDLFVYDVNVDRFIFCSEKLPLSWSSIRNVLIELGFLSVTHRAGRQRIEVEPAYEKLISDVMKPLKNKLTLEELKKELQRNEEAGELAEEFVLDYERRRHSGCGNAGKVKRISSVDVTAGYDILSFDSSQSLDYDRFIEVKAVKKYSGFFWSRNEMEIARVLGIRYYLYLVDLGKITIEDYEPIIVSDPANELTTSGGWSFRAQSFYVQKSV